MGRALFGIMIALLSVSSLPVRADELSGSKQFLCAAVRATVCGEDGECAAELPWKLNVPEFIVVDLEAKRLATTAASGEGRTTVIEDLRRGDGAIVFHGYEMGRAFSFVIDEQSGWATVAVATDGAAVAVFGNCTPLPAAAAAQ